MRTRRALAVVGLVVAASMPQDPAGQGLALPVPATAVRDWRAAHEHEVMEEFADLVRLPNVSRNLDDVRANATFIQAMFKKRGVELRRLEAPGAAPALFGEVRVPRATTTVVLYAHYDGQPVDMAQWLNKRPFTPELRDAAGSIVRWPARDTRFDPEWRLHGRSTGDDKAPIVAFAAALDALKAAGRAPTVNLKFFLDGEEEIGSPHLHDLLVEHQALLASDGWLFFDSPIHQSRRQQLVFGARSNVALTFTLYGANTELHAGHYGNWAPNPALQLAQLIASMKDERGRVSVRGFYDQVEALGPIERAALRAFPNVDVALQEALDIGGLERPGRRIEEAITQPSLTVRSLTSGGVGGVIPSTATAVFRVDFVKGMEPATTVEQIKAHVRARGFTVLDHDPTPAERRAHAKVLMVRSTAPERAVRTSMDAPFSKRVIAALEAGRGPVLKQPNMGGAVPLTPIDEVLKAPVIIVPIANHDDNQHTHDENLRLQNLWDGIETVAALMQLSGDVAGRAR
jgi:acetylornithine deacetylase/succinyl-diaminopimelate desuccinylase-like protein